MKRMILYAVVAGSLTLAVRAAAQAPASAPVTAPKFFAISELTPPQGASPSLLNGRVANPKDFPASFYSRSGNAACTSTLVGPRVMLTAAHCVQNGAVIEVQHNQQPFHGVCTRAPEYAETPAGRTFDWALCELDGPIGALPYERLNQNSARITVGTELLLSGFGCTKSNGTGGDPNVYRIGESQVTATPVPPSNDITTSGGAALCFGDSGGPAFLFLDPGKTRRVQVSVNSRGNIVDTSLLSSVSSAAAAKFFTTWSGTAPARKICGVHPDVAGCRPE